LRNLNSLKKRDVKVEIERNKNGEYREIKRETISEDNKKAKNRFLKRQNMKENNKEIK